MSHLPRRDYSGNNPSSSPNLSYSGSPQLHRDSPHVRSIRNSPQANSPLAWSSSQPGSPFPRNPSAPSSPLAWNPAPPGSPLARNQAPGSPLTRNSPVPQTLSLGHTSPQVQLRRAPDSPQLKNGSAQSSPSLRSVNGQNGATSGNKIKCVFIGDGAVGKTSLIISYTTNGYPNEYVPTAIDTYHAVVHVDGQPLTLELCDTPGQDDFDTLRPLVYPNTDVFLLCFSVALPSSFHNVREKWIPEVRASCGKVPVVLVGTQSDLREDAKTLVQLRQTKEHPVQEHEARKLAQSLGCEMYVECSSLTQRNLKDVFDSAIVAGISSRKSREKKKNKKKKHCVIL